MPSGPLPSISPTCATPSVNRDTLEIARDFGLSTHPAWRAATSSTPAWSSILIAAPGMSPLIDAWLPLSLALNSLNRTMGLSDLYPFLAAGDR